MAELWNPSFAPAVIGGVSVCVSERAQDTIAAWQKGAQAAGTKASIFRSPEDADVAAFVRLHAGPPEHFPGESAGFATEVRLERGRMVKRYRLSWMDWYGDECRRLILVDVCGRTLLGETNDLQRIIDSPLNPVSMQLWRQAIATPERRGEIQSESASRALRLLLDELERLSILQVFRENGLDDGKFI